jgi:hypothetical protein
VPPLTAESSLPDVAAEAESDYTHTDGTDRTFDAAYSNVVVADERDNRARYDRADDNKSIELLAAAADRSIAADDDNVAAVVARLALCSY